MKTKITNPTTTTPMRPMMRSAVLAAALVMGGVAGCDKKSEPAKTNVPKPPAPDVTPKATSGGMSSSAATPSSAAGAGAGAGVKSSPTTAPTTPAPSGATQPGAPIVDAPLVTSTESAKHSKEAQDLVGKAMQEIKDKKFDDAKSALDKVDAMGDDVPRETRELAKTVRKSLESARKLQQAPDLPAGEGPNK
jgi:hypothetical protein